MMNEYEQAGKQSLFTPTHGCLEEALRKSSVTATAPGLGDDTLDSAALLEIQEEFDTADVKKFKGMAKNHYVDKTERELCLSCNRKFSLKLRPRHCRRCGEIFCIRCLQQQTKLNKLASQDPAGKMRKVCNACFDACKTVFGCTRNLMKEFVHERTMLKYERVLHQRANSLTTTFWRDQLDINSECRRLLVGFEHAVAKSKTKQAFQGLREVVNVPTWQQSSFWTLESATTKCRACKGSLGVRKLRRNCKVCGLTLCKKCSYRELLVYYPDPEGNAGRKGSNDSRTSGLSMYAGNTPKLSIINIHGMLVGVKQCRSRPASASAGLDLHCLQYNKAPSSEPSVSLLLHVCHECKTYIAEHQAQNEEWSLETSGPVETLINTNNQIQGLQDAIESVVLSCQTMCNKDIQNDKRYVKPKVSDMKSLKTTLEELDGYLLEFEVQMKTLKELLSRAESKTQSILIGNYTKGKHEFLIENRQTLRQLRKL